MAHFYRSLVPALPPISTGPVSHSPISSSRPVRSNSSQRNKAYQYSQHHDDFMIDSAVGGYPSATYKDLIVKVTDMCAELSRMKNAIGRLEAARNSQDIWLKERYDKEKRLAISILPKTRLVSALCD